MEPSNVVSAVKKSVFSNNATISFWFKKPVSENDIIGAVMQADAMKPWWDLQASRYARLRFESPRLVSNTELLAIYEMKVQSVCLLKVSQLEAYTKYVAQLAEDAQQFLGNKEHFRGTKAKVEFSCTPMTFDIDNTVKV
jgi:hypothetical protein